MGKRKGKKPAMYVWGFQSGGRKKGLAVSPYHAFKLRTIGEPIFRPGGRELRFLTPENGRRSAKTLNEVRNEARFASFGSQTAEEFLAANEKGAQLIPILGGDAGGGFFGIGSGGGGKGSARLGAINLNAFTAIMDKFRRDIGEWTLDMYKNWSKDYFTNIVEGTPWKTGRAQSNWQASLGGVGIFSLIGAPRKSSPSSSLPVFRNPIPSAHKIINALNDKLAPLTFFNNVAYISNLDQGSSKQAPQGILAVALIKTSATLGGYVDALDAAVSLEDVKLDERYRNGF